MNDFIEETRGKVASAKLKEAGDTLKLVLEINSRTGALIKAGGVIKDKVLPALDEDGEPVDFAWWHHQDILISNSPRNPNPGRDGDCPPGYTSTVICGIKCCVPIS